MTIDPQGLLQTRQNWGKDVAAYLIEANARIVVLEAAIVTLTDALAALDARVVTLEGA